MEAAKKPRLKLSRRRPPPGDWPPASGPRPQLDDDGPCAQPWAALLRAGSADLSPEGAPPPLPAFLGQEPARPQCAPTPEDFSVGAQVFSWTPFPPAPRGGPRLGRASRLLPVAAELRAPGPCSPKPPASEPPGADARRTPPLRSCPMCQADFKPTLTQMDIDDHLAQCLAESTEDMVW